MSTVDYILSHARKGDAIAIKNLIKRGGNPIRTSVSKVLCAFQNTPVNTRTAYKERRKIISTLQSVIKLTKGE